MPLALDTIEAKLERREYPNLTTLESDVKRLVANAKGYNEKTSELFADAERIRKMVSHFMQKHNPAYRDPNYAAFPTPLPDDVGSSGITAPSTRAPDGAKAAVDVDGDAHMNANVNRSGTRSTRKSSHAKAASVQSADAAAISASPAAEDSSGDFEGKTFQAAQEQIVAEMIKLKNDE